MLRVSQGKKVVYTLTGAVVGSVGQEETLTGYGRFGIIAPSLTTGKAMMETSRRPLPQAANLGWCEPGMWVALKIPPELLTEMPVNGNRLSVIGDQWYNRLLESKIRRVRLTLKRLLPFLCGGIKCLARPEMWVVPRRVAPSSQGWDEGVFVFHWSV